MSLALSPTYVALGPNLTRSFLANGGSAPYVYSVRGGGAGGSINSSTGLYTAPNATGIDTIVVTDSLLNTAQSTVLIGNALELFCDVIQTSLGLSQGQVFLWDQKINLPTDSQLYIAVGILSAKPFANSNKLNSSGNSVQSINMMATLSVDIFSRGPAARDQKEFVLMALASNYSIAQQEANSFYVAPISTSFVNLSEIDGAAIPYRFNISVNIQYFVTNTTAAPYYTSFQTPPVTTED
jgi:hypothetical protein